MFGLNTRPPLSFFMSLGEDRTDAAACLNIQNPPSDFVYEFKWFDKVLGIVSVITFLLDFGFDIYMVVKYFTHREMFYGAVTLVWTAGPSLIACGFSLYWYILDYKHERRREVTEIVEDNIEELDIQKPPTPCYKWILRFTLSILQLGPVIRMVEGLYHGWKYNAACEKGKEARSKEMIAHGSERTAHSEKAKVFSTERKRHYDLFLSLARNGCLLRMFESFLESAPQLIWQTYIMLTIEEDVVLLSRRVLTLLTSWLSLTLPSVTLYSYNLLLRVSNKAKRNLLRNAQPIYLLWRTCEIGNRMISISLFASTFHAYVFIPLGIHWVLMAAWLMCQRTRFYNHDDHGDHSPSHSRIAEFIFNAICGYVMIFCFFNAKEGQTRYRYIVYYGLFYTENFTMLGLCFLRPPHIRFGEWLRIAALVLVLFMFLVHVVFQLIYYQLCHPRRENIELNLSTSCRAWFDNLFYNTD